MLQPLAFVCFLSLYSLVAFAFCTSIFAMKFFLIFILVPVYTYFVAPFSVARVSHDETKLSRERRRSVMGGIQGSGDGGGSGRRETAVGCRKQEGRRQTGQKGARPTT